MLRRRAVLLLIACLALPCEAAWSHPLAPSLLEVREQAGARALVLWKRPLAATGRLEPVLPSSCTPVAAATERTDGVARTIEMPVECGGSLVGERFGVSGLATGRTDVLLRIALLDGRVVHQVLRPGAETFVVPGRESALAVSWSYLGLGFEHVLGGADHLLFVLGLLLLASDRRRLVAMVTAFTAGHSVTLSLAALADVRLPATPVEVLIAATILVLACELARTPVGGATLPQRRPASPRRRSAIIQRRPAIITFGFGLLHGLGFAGALREAGLPQGEVALALFGFNLGIEAGQLAFVAALLAAGFLVARWDRASRFGRIGAAYAIGSVAACLVIERTIPLFG